MLWRHFPITLLAFAYWRQYRIHKNNEFIPSCLSTFRLANLRHFSHAKVRCVVSSFLTSAVPKFSLYCTHFLDNGILHQGESSKQIHCNTKWSSRYCKESYHMFFFRQTTWFVQPIDPTNGPELRLNDAKVTIKGAVIKGSGSVCIIWRKRGSLSWPYHHPGTSAWLC